MGQTSTGVSGFLDPERIVSSFGLKSGDHVADFGAGHGYFTIPMARSVGREGKIWAIDVQKSALDIIRSKARLEHFLNIAYVHADLEEPGASGLADKFIDFVVIANILFQAERKDIVLREAWRILRDKGRLALVEWDPQSASLDTGQEAGRIGPLREYRVKKEEARAIAAQAGFELDREISAGPHHYGLIFIRP